MASGRQIGRGSGVREGVMEEARVFESEHLSR